MAISIKNRTLILVAVVCVIAAAAWLIRPARTSALPAYAAATGQACGVCHINPAGGGPRTAIGQAFEGIPTHATDPAGAWAQVSAAAAPSPAPPAAPPAAPAATSGPISVAFSGASNNDSVTYAVIVSNSGKDDISNVFVSGGIPAGAAFSAVVATPSQAGKAAGDPEDVTVTFLGNSDTAVAWDVSAVPAGSSVGPFVYKVSKQNASNLAASGFAHWTAPADGTAVSPTVPPLTDIERLNIQGQINSAFNNLDRTNTLWNIQPGLGTVMIEYATRMNNMWFAAQAGNWTMVHYQIGEMTEIQETGENTRPGRAPALKNFEANFLDPLDDTAEAKDLAAFTAAYDKALTGCNACHAGSSKAGEFDSFKFVKVKRPTAPTISLIDWKGQ